MTLDRITLRWARAEALARLARSLGIDLPRIPDEGFRRDMWRRAAVRRIAEVTDPVVLPDDTRAGAA
jgi:hypothetical protein